MKQRFWRLRRKWLVLKQRWGHISASKSKLKIHQNTLDNREHRLDGINYTCRMVSINKIRRHPPSRINHVEDWLSKKVNINKDATLPINEKMTDMMYKSLLWQSAPDIEIDLFGCNPVEFNYFMSLFEEIAESKTEDQKGRLARFPN